MRVGSRSAMTLKTNLIRDRRNAAFKVELEKQKILATKELMDTQTTTILRSRMESDLVSNSMDTGIDMDEESYEVDGDFDDF